MIQSLLKMILPTYPSKNGDDELWVYDTNTMSADEIWVKTFNSQFADLNRRADEAQENLVKHRKRTQKHRHR